MIKLRLNTYATYEFKEDLEILHKQLLEKGYYATKEDISYAWQAYSGGLCAQWLCLSDNSDENVELLLRHFKEEKE